MDEELTGNELIESLIDMKENALRNDYDPKVVALINLIINNGDVVEMLAEDLNEL